MWRANAIRIRESDPAVHRDTAASHRLVCRRAVQPRHRDAEEPVVDRELGAVMDDVVQQQTTDVVTAGTGDEDGVTVAERPGLAKGALVE